MSWQKILGQGYHSVNDLLSFLELPSYLGSELAEQQFPSRVPLGFAARMKKGNPHDPLLLQTLASVKELDSVEGYHPDPLDEESTNTLKGLIHKYHGRVLLTLTGACAINCRYCFRRHFPYQKNNPGRQGWRDVYDYIKNDESITEVILSGGDPLLASDTLLSELIRNLDRIPHLHTLRIHSRIPIVFPERIDDGLLGVLAETRLKKIVVLHCNHPQELDETVRQACSKLQKIGCHLLNQSVLLAAINDDARVLSTLSQTLFAYGVMPYYLHVLDKVTGASHFDLPFSKVQSIYRELQNLIPGYLLPRLAKEEPGKGSKTLLL